MLKYMGVKPEIRPGVLPAKLQLTSASSEGPGLSYCIFQHMRETNPLLAEPYPFLGGS